MTNDDRSKPRGAVENVLGRLDALSASPTLRKATYTGALVFFVAIILVPPIIGILLKWNLIGETLQNPAQVARAQSAILASFAIAFTVSTMDLLAGLPMAWLIVRRKG